MISVHGGRPGQLSANRGFTLIEVMIVIAIVSVLLAIALPSYENSMQKGRRADAKAHLMAVANQEEQFMLDQGTYTTNLADLSLPVDSPDGHYTVSAAACGTGDITRCYTLTAEPRAGSPQIDDLRCTEFVLESNGLKTADGTDQDNCW